MTYSEKLKDPRWQKKRLEIMQRDGFKCMHCGDTETTLHVHHEMYIGRDPWDTPDYCLTTLCEDCHSIDHLKFTPLEKFLISCLRNRHRGDTDMVKRMNLLVRHIVETGEVLV